MGEQASFGQYQCKVDRKVAQGLVQPFTPAAFRRAWADPRLSAEDVGRRFGLGLHAAHWRAKALELPRKSPGNFSTISRDEFTAMWLAGVSGAEMATHFGVNDSNIARAAKRFDLPGRRRGARRKMTLAQYHETLLAKAMAETARLEQAQIKLAEMWDQPGHNTSGKRKAA